VLKFPRTLGQASQAFGDYEILDRISVGGMAQVFRARHVRNGNIVALKRVLPDVAEDQEAMQMFEDEARICVHLEHPYIARMLDYGHVDSTFFIAFEYVHGKDLRFVFDRSVRTKTEVPTEILLYIFRHIAEGLAYAHARKDVNGEPVSIVHRDVSPQNIVVSFDGDVKLIDFGIAKAAGRLSRTQAGSIKGKFGYMSPEQVLGREVDARTDVFSLGICMWELLTGQRLFSGANELVVLEKIKGQMTVPPSTLLASGAGNLPPELDRIILKALAKDPAQRYRAAKELFRDLNIFCETQDFVATRGEIAQYMRRTFPEASGRDVAPRQPGPSLQTYRDKAPKIIDQPPESEPELQPEIQTDTRRDIQRFSPGQRARPPNEHDDDLEEPESERTAVRRNDEEMMNMAAEKQGGSDLDIFEGLGKKNAAQPGRESSAPPPPPSSMKTPAAKPSAPPQVVRGDLTIGKKTLLGVQSPVNAAPPAPRSSQPSPNPVPAARASLPAITAPPQKNLSQSGSHAVPPAAETKPAGMIEAAKTAPAETLPNNAVQMDWDDDEEQTHVLDREEEKPKKEGLAFANTVGASPSSSVVPMARPSAPPASSGPMSNRVPAARPSQAPPLPNSARNSARPATGLSAPPPPPPPPSAGFRSVPPIAQTLNSQQPVSQNVQQMSQPAGSFPPPSQSQAPQANPFQMPIQTHTAPMNMPGGSQQNQGMNQQQQSPSYAPSGPPRQQHQSVPPPSLPPVQSVPQMQRSSMTSRLMEQTQMVRPPSNRNLFIGLGAAAVVGVIAVVALMPSKAKLAINVTDAKGAMVNRVDIFVDGKKECETAPCILDVTSGAHEVKALAPGADAAIRAVTVESRKDSTMELVIAASKGGTGIKVQGNQPGVKLSVDGKDIGTLPQDVTDLTPGDHKIRVAGSERYTPLEKNVTVAKDEMQDLGNISLAVIKGKATITLGTVGAKVYLVSGTDRRDLPTFPISVDIDTSKSWTLQAIKPGFSDYNQPISFADGQAEKTFDVELAPKGAATTSTYTPPAVVHNTTPSTPKPPKPDNAGGGDTSAAASGGDATLNINSFPSSAIILDGKPLGQTPQLKISVPAGEHTVTFINSDQNLKKTMKVTVAAGDTKPVIAKLKADN